MAKITVPQGDVPAPGKEGYTLPGLLPRDVSMKRLLPLALMLAAACGGSGGTAMAPDFLLEDVNPNSATANQDVSPRDYLTYTSAYYFGAAT